MRTGTIIAILAVFLAAGLVPQFANADGGDCNGDGHCGGACNQWARISSSDATCLGAGWDNSPPASSGVAGGSTNWAKNECSNNGDIVAHIDYKDNQDEHYHLQDSTTKRTGRWVNDVRDISCCIDESDLCWKDQVEPIASGELEGHIRFIKLESGSYWVGHSPVRTHEERYAACGHYPDSIYCQKNPSGDAFTIPASYAGDRNSLSMADVRALPCGVEGYPACWCGERACDRFDCEAYWNRSPMATATEGPRCHTLRSMLDRGRGEAHPRCEFSADCIGYNDVSVTLNNHVEILWSVDNLEFCADGRTTWVERNDQGGCQYDFDCGDHYCTDNDCALAFRASPAADSCRLEASILQEDTRYCFFSSSCDHVDYWLPKSSTVIMLREDAAENLNNCNGFLTDGSC